MDIENLKRLIAEKAEQKIDDIVKEFVCNQPDFKELLLNDISEPNNWQWYGDEDEPMKPERIHGGCLERCFDCEPLDGQLRAYVITDPSDTELLEIRICGE